MLSTYGDRLEHIRLERRKYPPPHKKLDSSEAIDWRKIQTNTFPNLFILHKISPTQYQNRCPWYSLRVSAIPTSVHWQRWLSLTSTRGARLRYARTFYALFNADNTPTSRIEDLLETEDAVNNIISRSVHGAAREARSVRLGVVGLHTPNVSSAQWMAFLGAHLRPHELRADDRMLLTDGAPFAALNRLLARFTNRELLRFVAWWFVQEHADIARSQALHTIHKLGPAAEDARPITCYAVAESRYESTLLPHRVASALQQSGVVAVKVIFRDIKAAASRLIAAAAWMDEKARKEAVAIISSVTLEPWSALFLEGSRLASDEPTPAALAVATEEQWWPPPHRTVFDRWLDAARQHKLLTANWPLDDSLLQRHSRLLEYDAWWNSVHLDPSVVTGLMVDAGAPPPALYGSLGAVMAQAVVQALDYRVGTFLDHERKLRDWLSPASRRAFLDRAVCAEREDVLMGVAALGVLLEAYRTSVVNESAYYDVREFRTRLTPEMMLFVAFCRTRCTLGRGCNELVRHVTAYSRAFGCATRAVKCSFFGE
ncbi:neprilysin-2-like [Amblyomma americanum]